MIGGVQELYTPDERRIMYRIRLVSGDEAQYGSIDELGAAVAAGIVTDKAEIFHARAEKWLPIASHPHFKLAKDKVSGGASRPAASRPSAPATNAPGAPRPSVVAPGTLRAAATASGVRPLSASGQRPAVVTGSRPGAPASRPQRPITAPRPAQPKPAPAPANDLGLLRADAAIDASPSESRPLPEIQLEQTPVIEEPRVEPARDSLPFIEQPPAQVELVSDEAAPAPSSARADIIHPDRAMPAVPVAAERDQVRELPSVEIPAPVRDFTPPAPEQEAHAHFDVPAHRPSRTPILIGIGVAAAAAIAAGFIFTRKPDAPGEKPAVTQVAAPAPAPVQTTTMAQDAGSVASDPSQLQAARNDDGSSRKGRKSSDEARDSDGLEPPPSAPVLPKAPSVKGIADAAALPTVDAGVPGMSDNQKALERTVREIDSSMRRESGKSGGSTR